MPATRKANRGPAWLVTVVDHFGSETTVAEEERLVKVYGRYLALILTLMLAISVSGVVGLALLTDGTLGGHIHVVSLIAAIAFSTAVAPLTLYVRRYLKNRRRRSRDQDRA